MRFTFLTLFCILFHSTIWSKVHVDIRGLKENVGQVVITVWESEESYLKEGYLSKTIKVGELVDSAFRVSFSEELPKECAINVYYDENSNGKLDTKIFGIPKELVGITNDAKGRFGPPKFKDGLVVITGKEQIFVINLGKA